MDNESPAGKAGLKFGDTIIKMGKDKITDLLQFQFILLSNYKSGESMEFSIRRNGKVIKIAVH